jgi:hypothetical protein
VSVFRGLAEKTWERTTGWASMVSSVSGMSFEKTSAFLERWPTPISYWEDLKKRIEQEESRDGDGLSAGTSTTTTTTKGAKRRRSSGATWIEEECGQQPGARSIKTALSTRWWELTSRRSYQRQ